MNKKVKKGLDIASIVLLAIIFVLGVAIMSLSLSRNQDGVPRLFGATFLSIQSESMVGKEKDNFNKGDIVVIQEVKDASELKVGDIITFQTIINGERALNTHRIIGITEYGRFITKGDNNGSKDDLDVAFNDIVGKYNFRIAGMGHFVDFLSSFWGFFVIIIIPLAAFLIYRVVVLIRIVLLMKKEKDSIKTDEETKSLQDELAALRAKVALLEDDTETKK